MVSAIGVRNTVPEELGAGHVALPAAEHPSNVRCVRSALAVGSVGHVEQLRVVVVFHSHAVRVVVLVSAAIVQRN